MIYVTEQPIVVPGLPPGDRPARMFYMLPPAMAPRWQSARSRTTGSYRLLWSL